MTFRKDDYACRRCGGDWAEAVRIADTIESRLCWPCRENWNRRDNSEIEYQLTYQVNALEIARARVKTGDDPRLRAINQKEFFILLDQHFAVTQRLRKIIFEWMDEGKENLPAPQPSDPTPKATTE